MWGRDQQPRVEANHEIADRMEQLADELLDAAGELQQLVTQVRAMRREHGQPTDDLDELERQLGQTRGTG